MIAPGGQGCGPFECFFHSGQDEPADGIVDLRVKQLFAQLGPRGGVAGDLRPVVLEGPRVEAVVSAREHPCQFGKVVTDAERLDPFAHLEPGRQCAVCRQSICTAHCWHHRSATGSPTANFTRVVRRVGPGVERCLASWRAPARTG